MRFWSEGLGDSELVISLDRTKVTSKDDCIALTGVVDSPAPWEYEVKIHFADWMKILDTATSRDTSEFVATHVQLGDLAGMAWSIFKFVVLLAAYRVGRLLHVAPVGSASLGSFEDHGTRKA
jgi:hypothetical protein